MTPPERIDQVVARYLARLERSRRRRRRLPPTPPPARRLEALPVDLEVSIRDRLGVSWHDRPRNLKDGTR